MQFSNVDQLLAAISNKIAELRVELPNHNIIFMLGNTVSNTPKKAPYSTPTRVYANDTVIGAIVFNQVDAAILAKGLSTKVDFFYVDSEKKLPIDLHPSREILAKHGITECDVKPEFGNISAAIIDHVDRDKIRYYKANDLIVDAAWNFLVTKFGELSGKKMAIIGLGNIGFKLALKLVESGVSIKILGKNNERYRILTEAINSVKNIGTLATASVAENMDYELLSTDCLILASSAKGVFGLSGIELLKTSSIVIDVGKGNITNEAVESGISRGIAIWRAEITGYLPSLIANNEPFSTYMKKFGRRECKKYFIISGGFVGKINDVVVDDYRNPKQVYGVCDGEGGFFNKNIESINSILIDLVSESTK